VSLGRLPAAGRPAKKRPPAVLRAPGRRMPYRRPGLEAVQGGTPRSNVLRFRLSAFRFSDDPEA